jgi:YidC/Oxa1 family membrane protein insertase
MDSRTLIALVLLGFAWFGWQSYLQNKYPEAYKQKSEQTLAVDAESAEKVSERQPGEPEQTVASEDSLVDSGKEQERPKIELNTDSPEQTFYYSNDKVAFELSSKGMGFNSFTINDHFDRAREPYSFKSSKGFRILETRLLGRSNALNFDVQKIGPGAYVGTARVGEMTIKKAIEIDPTSYLVKTKVDVKNADASFIGTETALELKLKDIETSSFLPTFERQEFFSYGSEGEERVLIDTSEPLKETATSVKVASVGTQYFSQAIVDKSKIAPEFEYSVKKGGPHAIGKLKYSALNKENFSLEYEAYIGPKYLNVMEKIDPSLASVIDFGFFSWLAKPMLQLLKLFYGFIGNWGVAIILLTLLIRMIVLPFTVMSYKSMNKMKVIQPRIKELREKYKDDAQKLNQEMMVLMKENKVNPLGGCLPMLLQFPVFIALYQVLGQSVELYQAPFAFWIQDLSLKDPYYVLPVLMGATMFVQQKITPNTMDPQQAKVMMFLPLVFVLFMVGLPSGLTLYIFVSSLFAILQQFVFMRDTIVSKEIQTA